MFNPSTANTLRLFQRETAWMHSHPQRSGVTEFRNPTLFLVNTSRAHEVYSKSIEPGMLDRELDPL